MKYLAILMIYSTSVFAAAPQFTLGTRSSYFFDDNKLANSFLYAQTEYSYENYDNEMGLKLNFDIRAMDYYSSNEKTIVDPVNLSAEFLLDSHRFQIGFVRYRFSETFGLQLLDIANPRDYSEFIFNDLSWAKRSVFGMNHTVKYNRLETQFILTLWPNGDRLPYKGSPFNEDGFIEGGVVERPWFKNPEYGVRTKYLFESGLDLSLLYFHHFARSTPGLNEQVDSFGLAFSYVHNEWVLRGDNLYTLSDFVQPTFLQVEEKNHFQSLWGIDRVWENFTLGLQVQFDFNLYRHYAGGQFEYSAFDVWKPAIMVFKNIKREDYWLQVKNRFSIGDFNINLTYDSFGGEKTDKDLFGHFSSHDRFLIDVSASF